MFSNLSVRRSLLPIVLVAVAPLAASAQESQLFTWTGRVDREIRLTVQGSSVTNTYEQNMQTRARLNEKSALPSRAGNIRVTTESGRGSVTVDQQPDASNGYTSIIRIVDNDGGSDNYRISAYYTPSNDSRNGRDRYDRGRDDRRDDRYGRRDDRSGRTQNMPAFHWTGDVDTEAELVWHNGAITTRALSGAPVRGLSTSISGDANFTLEREVQLSVRQGRGRAYVIQSPSARNNYTAIIRIQDTQSGYGHYELDGVLR